MTIHVISTINGQENQQYGDSYDVCDLAEFSFRRQFVCCV